MRSLGLGTWALAIVVAIAIVLGDSAAAQVTQLVSVNTPGGQGNGGSYRPSISADGRCVAFESYAWALDYPDTNNAVDIFVRDRATGTTERVNVDSNGAQAELNRHSYTPSISADGRYVTFASWAGNLVPGDTNLAVDVFVHDRQTGVTERVSVGPAGVQANDMSEHFYAAPVSADGRFVAFTSRASNLVPGDSNGAMDVFVRDRQLGTNELVNVDSSGAHGTGFSAAPAMSANGRFVVFLSDSRDLVPGDSNGATDVFVRDRLSGTTERVSAGLTAQNGWESSFYSPAITPDGRFVAFDWSGCGPCSRDVLVRDRQTGALEFVSVGPGGELSHDETGGPSLSADGRFVAFWSGSDSLVAGDTNGVADVFLRDRRLDTTVRVSLAPDGAQGDGGSSFCSLTPDGSFLAFASDATNLVPGDVNQYADVFVHDFAYGAHPSSCDPGVGGVMSCPCSNPPAGPDRGCDNSSATGGASLSTSGGAFLSSDSLVLTTSGEKPTALSVVRQGTSTIPAGTVHGQGVRCVGGTIKRMYTKSAVGGSISAPNFAAGDPSVHDRSATLGDPITPGSTRWYFVYYRDPIVLGGCPPVATFNTTQTRAVAWLP